jgi:DNA-binding response OmpR family regulator
VADDDPDILRLLALFVRSAGWEVITAAQGREAINLFNQHADRIRLVFLDEEMPECDGHAVLQVIRSRHPHLAVVIVSGHGREACERRFAGLRPTAVLTKPFRREELLALLDQI